MAKSDSVLGKHTTISITHNEGPVNAFPIMLSFDDDTETNPEEIHFMGHMDPSHIPDTGTKQTATFTTTDRQVEFNDWYNRNIVSRKLFGVPYPEVGIQQITQYANGEKLIEKYKDVMFTRRGRKRNGDTHQEHSYSVILTLESNPL